MIWVVYTFNDEDGAVFCIGSGSGLQAPNA